MNQKISTGLGAAILLVMVFTAGYFVWVIEKNNQQSLLVLSESTTLPSIARKQIAEHKDTSAVSSTSGKTGAVEDIIEIGTITKVSDDWNTYSNSAIGLEISYPSRNWFVDESENPIKIWHYSKSINYLDSYVEYMLSKNSALKEFNNFNECNEGLDPFCSQEQEVIVIDGRKAYKAITGYEGSPATTYYVEKNKSESIIVTFGGFQSGCEENQPSEECLCKDDAQCTQLENKIRSSIKLVD